MKKLYCALFLIVCVASVFAQFEMMSGTSGVVDYKNGAWAEYKTEVDGKDALIRYAIVGTEKIEGKDCFWWEYRVKDVKSGETNKIKMLTSGKPEDRTGTISFIAQKNDEEAIEYVFKVNYDSLQANAEEMEKIAEQYEVPETETQADDDIKMLGRQTITVPAGTFDCQHIQVLDDKGKVESEVWISEKVMMGIVKSKDRDKNVSELNAYGNDGAKSEITGTPKRVEVDPDEFQRQLAQSVKEGVKEAVKEAVKESAKETAKDAVKQGVKGLFKF